MAHLRICMFDASFILGICYSIELKQNILFYSFCRLQCQPLLVALQMELLDTQTRWSKMQSLTAFNVSSWKAQFIDICSSTSVDETCGQMNMSFHFALIYALCYKHSSSYTPIVAATRSKTWVHECLNAGILSSNSAKCLDVWPRFSVYCSLLCRGLPAAWPKSKDSCRMSQRIHNFRSNSECWTGCRAKATGSCKETFYTSLTDWYL
jgi:hypothetical protein